MYKNQLQELAQRSCFNLPAYACMREGPDHAPRFKATVNFNGEVFESPGFCSTLRQAEHAAAEVALMELSRRGPSHSLAARILDETGVCKNLLQETAQKAGVPLPLYTTQRSGPGHLPVFTCTVEVAGMTFVGESAKTKKQAEKNAAMTAWTALKRSHEESDLTEEQEQSAIVRALSQSAAAHCPRPATPSSTSEPPPATSRLPPTRAFDRPPSSHSQLPQWSTQAPPPVVGGRGPPLPIARPAPSAVAAPGGRNLLPNQHRDQQQALAVQRLSRAANENRLSGPHPKQGLGELGGSIRGLQQGVVPQQHFHPPPAYVPASIWAGPTGQQWGMCGQYAMQVPVLAAPVVVRPMVAVCASGPRFRTVKSVRGKQPSPAGADSEESSDDESPTHQVLSSLNNLGL